MAMPYGRGSSFPGRLGKRTFVKGRAVNMGRQAALPGLAPEEEKLDELEGTLERVVFHNPENGYTVFRMRIEGEEDLATVVGAMSSPQPGSNLRVRGHWTSHPKFGRQMQMISWEEHRPATTEGIRLFLASGCIKGVGPRWADRIVARFGTETLRVLDEDPDRLLELPRFGRKRLAEVKSSWAEHQGVRELMMFLQPHGIGPSYAVRIYRFYGAQALAVVQENPYRLAMDIHGIGFATADALAAKLGFEPDSPLRAEAGVLYILLKIPEEGHIYYPRAKLVEAASQQLDIAPELIDEALGKLELEERVVIEDLGEHEGVYLSRNHLYESKIAFYLQRLLRSPKAVRFDDAKKTVREVRERLPMQLADEQREAVYTAATAKVMVLTGGPGTGKTTTVNAILSLYEALYDRVALCAPTGRAAKRLSELTNHAASTIHRLLEVDYSSGSVRFIHNEKNLLKYDVIILDEMSMVDVKLFQALLAAARYHCRIIMVGGADQLPSVGPGNILGEILKAGVVPTVRLTDIFRQAQRSLIVQNAHRIVEGQMPQKGGPKDDFFLIESNGLACQKLVCDLVSTRLPKAYGFDPVRDIQVLCPTKVGPTGSVELNRRLQDILNPPAKGKGQIGTAESAKILRLGDKVMQVKNDYDITFERAGAEAGVGAYNGDLGIITAVDVDARSVTVQMDDKKYTYTADQLNELEPAYAVTVHKSQGSEFPAVILPVADVPARLCYRNLLYTGVTRARKLCVLTGTARTEQTMVENVRQNMRYSGLRYLLKDAATPTEEKQEQLSAT